MNYKLSSEELRELQLVLLEMLIELDRICKKYSIRYCLIAGTLLGAVRHKGFIPWDDDLDVAMMRGEYERFREACKMELHADKFFFQDNTTDPHYPWGYGRLRRLGSEFVRVGQEHLKMRTGIFLDVFPIDNVPDLPPVRGLFTAYCFLLRKILYSRVGAVSEKNKAKRACYRLLRNIPSALVFKRLDRLYDYGRGRKTKYARILTFPTPKGRPYGYLRKWYTDVSTIEFEGGTFPCVRDWDEYLTYKFGDYMTLPPPEQRHWHAVSKFSLPLKAGGDIMRIAVAGIGYVGLANAVLLARRQEVVITDILPQKVAQVNNRVSPLDDKEIIQAFTEESLQLSAKLADECNYSDFDYVVIATPTDYDSSADSFNTKSVESVIDTVLKSTDNSIIVVRSTVSIGFTEQMNAKYFTDRIIFAPEFLREGKALFDARNPSRIIVGGKQEYAEHFANILLNCADKSDIAKLIMDSSEAESVKLFSNAYLAMRVAYINEVDTFAAVRGLNSRNIIDGMCLDPRISNGYNNPSFGYGGYCLPKDTKQLSSAFKGVPSDIIAAIVDANESRKQFIANELLKCDGVIGIYRLAMKSGSDNFRESSVLNILKILKRKGKQVIIYEPLLTDETYCSCEVCNALIDFKAKCAVIVANRVTDELADVKDKLYTRDVFGSD